MIHKSHQTKKNYNYLYDKLSNTIFYIAHLIYSYICLCLLTPKFKLVGKYDIV